MDINYKDPKVMAGIAAAVVVVIALVMWVAKIGPFA